MRRTTLLAAAVVVAGLLAPATAAASRSQFTIFEANRELRSDNTALRQRTLDEIKRSGVHWLRAILYWRDVAPAAGDRSQPDFDEDNPADPAYDWHIYDRMINEARARGMRVLVTISGPVPRWATLGGSTTRYPSPTHFGRFVEAVGARYAHMVKYWSIWNEPNHPDFLGPQFRHGKPYSPHLYRRLFRHAHRALDRSGNRHDRVLMGETAPRGNRHVVAPLAFLRKTLCLNRHYHRKHRRHHRNGCKRLKADGYAHHAYTTHAGPRFVSPRRDDVTIGSLGRLRRALNKAGRAHAIRRHMGIYLTEFGIQSKPDPYYGVSETRQNEYRAISERIAYHNHRVRAFSQYLMRDDLPREGRPYIKYGGFESGLRHSGGRRKKAYRGFKLPLVADRSSHRRVRLWGLVRPAPRRPRAQVQYRRRGHHHHWRRLERVHTNGRGYWHSRTRYHRHRSYRVVWHDADGHRHKSPRVRVTRG